MGCRPRPGLLLLGLLAGACGLALLAYCLRFDRQRRSAPDFQRRLRESSWQHCDLPCQPIFSCQDYCKGVIVLVCHCRSSSKGRKKEREQAKEREKELRELKDTAKIQEFFLQEIQLGELWLTRGEQKKGIEHLVNAISVCTHPAQLIQVLEQTLPPQVFEMLTNRIPSLVQRLETALNEEEDASDE